MLLQDVIELYLTPQLFRCTQSVTSSDWAASNQHQNMTGVFSWDCFWGTEFMAKLTEHLRFFICKKIQERHWEECFTAHWPLKTNCKLQSYWMLLVYSINECSFLDAAGCKHCASHDRKIQPGSALQWSFLVQRHLVRGNTRLWITSAKPRRSSYMLQPYSP